MKTFVYKRIIFKFNVGKQVVRMCTKIIWLRLGSMMGPCEHANELRVPRKAFFFLAELLLFFNIICVGLFGLNFAEFILISSGCLYA
jgi:hypothetical protein